MRTGLPQLRVRSPARGALVALAASLLAACALAGPAAVGAVGAARPAQPGPLVTVPEYDALGRLIGAPLAPIAPHARLASAQAIVLVRQVPKVRAWLSRYPERTIQTEATWDEKADQWTVNAWSGKAGQILTAKLDDATGNVTEVWTGPQVAWTMARGYTGSFGGDLVNDPWLWLGLSAAFLLGLGDLRRPLCLRNADLLVLLSLLGSLWLFNQGDVFGAIPAAMAPLAWLLGRLAWVGCGRSGRARRHGRGEASSAAGGGTGEAGHRGTAAAGRRARLPRAAPVVVLVAATVFALGLRVGLNAEDSNVIDVGYAGVIGAHRIAHGQAPWGNFPVEDSRPACGPADAAGETRDRIQTNGRCESANPRGDTYGPTAYLAYLPGYGIEGWDGKWNTGRGWSAVPAVHLTSVIWDAIALLGLALVGRRFGGARLAAMLPFAWATYPLTLYAYMSNTNDSIAPALLVLGFWLVTSPWARGAAVAAAGWAKLAGLVLLPLWAAYPDGLLGTGLPRRAALRVAAGFVLATLALFSILLLEPDLLHAVRVFVERTFSWQLGRDSPFSLWDWGQYHARGIPALAPIQHVLQALLVLAAVAMAFFPRGRRTPRQLAALSGALLVGFELVLTHWSWLYVPWFFPFATIALLVPRAAWRAAAGAVATPAAQPAPPGPVVPEAVHGTA